MGRIGHGSHRCHATLPPDHAARRLAGEQITEVWIFEADQYEVDELLGG